LDRANIICVRNNQQIQRKLRKENKLLQLNNKLLIILILKYSCYIITAKTNARCN